MYTVEEVRAETVVAPVLCDKSDMIKSWRKQSRTQVGAQDASPESGIAL